VQSITKGSLGKPALPSGFTLQERKLLAQIRGLEIVLVLVHDFCELAKLALTSTYGLVTCTRNFRSAPDITHGRTVGADLRAARREGHFRRFSFLIERDGLCAVRLIIFRSSRKEKNGTARRPSLPRMNKFNVTRVSLSFPHWSAS
jgi:hypothetical protein